MITNEQKDTINRYASLKKDIKTLELQADELNKEVLDIMETNELGEISLDIGKLSLGSRRNWVYSKKVDELTDTLKEQKQLEERTGTAQYSEKHYCIFKGSKEE